MGQRDKTSPWLSLYAPWPAWARVLVSGMSFSWLYEALRLDPSYKGEVNCLGRVPVIDSAGKKITKTIKMGDFKLNTRRSGAMEVCKCKGQPQRGLRGTQDRLPGWNVISLLVQVFHLDSANSAMKCQNVQKHVWGAAGVKEQIGFWQKEDEYLWIIWR